MTYDEAFRAYKRDFLTTGAATEDTFNGVDGVGTANFPYNDEWSATVMNSFMELTESVEEKIDELEANENPVINTVDEEKKVVTNLDTEHISAEVNSEKVCLQKSIATFVQEVTSSEEMSVSRSAALQTVSDKLKIRLDQIRVKSRNGDDALRNEIN